MRLPLKQRTFACARSTAMITPVITTITVKILASIPIAPTRPVLQQLVLAKSSQCVNPIALLQILALRRNHTVSLDLPLVLSPELLLLLSSSFSAFQLLCASSVVWLASQADVALLSSTNKLVHTAPKLVHAALKFCFGPWCNAPPLDRYQLSYSRAQLLRRTFTLTANPFM